MSIAKIETPEKTISTPWGNAVYLQSLDNGAVYYATQDYGGMGVTKAWALNHMTVTAQSFAKVWRNKLWYGRDREIYIAFLEQPKLFTQINGTEAKPKEFETIVRTFLPEYFSDDYKASVESEERLPKANELQQGDEVTLISFGSPDSARSYRFVAPYGKQQKSYILVDENGCVTKISRPKLKQDALSIQRGSTLLWERD